MSIAGKRTRPTGGNRGLLSGSGPTINGVFETTRQSTTILTTVRHAPAPVLISGCTHILDPGTRTAFKTVEILGRR
jgi:4-diphosphocytidyl-2C-methyl-D-erythritol kinase